MPFSAPETALVSVIVPTLNEAENIDLLLSSVFAAAPEDMDFEILIADGGSSDGTVKRVRDWEASGARLRLVPAPSGARRSLAASVLAAARLASGDTVVVMDADLSHPPERIGALARPVIADACDMAIGSRYVPGGATPDWPWTRRLMSRVGGLLARPLTDAKDPMSGFFAVRKARLLAVDPEASGFKIGLEILARGGDALRLAEIPILFRDRRYGRSKIGAAQILAYVRRLAALAGGRVSAQGAARFAVVGVLGVFVDLLVFQTLFALGMGLAAASFGGFLVATLSNFAMNARWAFAEGSGPLRGGGTPYARFLAVCLLALAVRGGALACARELFGLAPQAAIIPAIGAAALISYLGSAFFVFPAEGGPPREIRWRTAAAGLAAYAVLLRLTFMGVVDLIPEEAYYWNYAQHPDIGYLDHPPMTAWLIGLGTQLLGDTELGVRLFAWLGWFATAVFAFRLARNLFGSSAAFVTLLLVATLPFPFASGLIMTPDAPLAAAWAATLFYLERALLGERRSAWLGVGIGMGLGMLSKYTIGLLAPATLLFLLIDPSARRWLRRPEPYLAAAVGLALFSPVILWNLRHDWASFAFQTTRRLSAPVLFSTHDLLGSMAVLLTPVGLAAAGLALWRLLRGDEPRPAASPQNRAARFIAVFTLTPLCVFVLFSLTHATKLNWTGPLWLALLPAMAAGILKAGRTGFGASLQRLWGPTAAAALLIYGLGLNALALGLPGLGPVGRPPNLPAAWSEFGREAARIADAVAQEAGERPLLIGMDAYFTTSELAFYAAKDGAAVPDAVGRGVLGRSSLMYGFWFRSEDLRGRPALLIGFKRPQLDDPALEAQFASLGPVLEGKIMKSGVEVATFHYRVGLGLHEAAALVAEDGGL